MKNNVPIIKVSKMSSGIGHGRQSLKTRRYEPVHNTASQKMGIAEKKKRAEKASANKKAKHEKLIADMSCPQEQAEMETPWDQIECAMMKSVYKSVAIFNYMKFKMKMSNFVISGTNEEEQVFSDLIKSKGGYFYYKNLLVGVRKYGIVNSVPVCEDTVDEIVKTWGHDGMMMWIKYGFQ
jgi:sortase (surface protein transpeptidase)